MLQIISAICCLSFAVAANPGERDKTLRYFPNQAKIVDALGLGSGGENQQGEHWAVLVAGSNGWYNYRHQVCTLTWLIVDCYHKIL
jgi:hypothetical protein